MVVCIMYGVFKAVLCVCFSLTVLYADSMCDIAEAMNQAIQFEERLKTSAFFGPVCDYAIAPVARQVSS